MTLADLAVSCALDAVHLPAPRHGCIVWLSDGARVTRSTFVPKDGCAFSLDRWVDILTEVVGAGYARLQPVDASESWPLRQFRPVRIATPLVPTGIVILLPTRGGPVLEAAFDAGDAIEMPWLHDPSNAGCGACSLPRDWSIAAALLDIAQRSARAGVN
jgi:hypothetical protein